MIETEQKTVIAASIENVWAYVHDIKGWANLMPGLQSCTLTDADNSHWTLKVGVGGLVRTVNVQVHVEEWNGPHGARFTFKLDGDPVEGGGGYAARKLSPAETEIALTVRVIGSGPMAPMWEAMGKPLLPQFAKAFAEQLKTEIENANAGVVKTAKPALLAALWAQLQSFWRSLFGRPA